MNKNWPIIIIEDDPDDKDFFNIVFKELNCPNKVEYFTSGKKALEYLNRTDITPFMILSDINMPELNGFELREKVKTNEQLNIKCIPYLFFTTASDKGSVLKAYELSAQGFFTKPDSIEKLKKMMRKIIDYWTECNSPNEYAG